MDIANEPAEFMYATLCALSFYMAVLTLFGRRIVRHRWDLFAGNVALSANFGLLTLTTSGVLNMVHMRWVLRATLAAYGVTLCIGIAR